MRFEAFSEFIFLGLILPNRHLRGWTIISIGPSCKNRVADITILTVHSAPIHVGIYTKSISKRKEKIGYE